ncbi:hypothetical protein ES703_32425 [subsurface metagenome]
MNESCYVLIGKRIGRFWLGRLVKKTTGTASSVEFDWEWVLRREEEKSDILGFWHSHETDIRPSSRDIETMLAWIRCFGKRLVCIIQTENYRASYLCAFYGYNAQKTGILTTNRQLTNEEFKKLKRKWDKRYTGQKKVSRAIISTKENTELCAWKFFSKLYRLGNLFMGIE